LCRKGKGKLYLSTGHEGPVGKERYSSTISLTSAIDEYGWSTPRPSCFTRWDRDPVPIVLEAGWALRPVLMGAENLASTGNRSPDRQARSESLYGLKYPNFMSLQTVQRSAV